MKTKLITAIFLLCLSFYTHAQYGEVRQVGNWEVSDEDHYADLSPQPNHSAERFPEPAILIVCSDNVLYGYFMLFSFEALPQNSNSKKITVSLQWDSNPPTNVTMLANWTDFNVLPEKINEFIQLLQKHETLRVRINDPKLDWTLDRTYHLQGAREALAIPLRSCK